MSQWQPTGSFVRAALGSLGLALVAVATGRPDVVVLAAPLAVFALGALLGRPRRDPTYSTQLARSAVREGEGTRIRTVLEGAEGIELAQSVLASRPMLATRPPRGVVTRVVRLPDESVVLETPVSPRRWGVHTVGAGVLVAVSPWGGFQWFAELATNRLRALPLAGAFDSRAPAPHPVGLVGAHRSQRPGDGSEFFGIRPFQVGDRLRRIQWRVSARTGELHVTATHAEEDTSILLVADAGVDVGLSQGLEGRASSLDTTVRAAAAVAEHYLRTGDRVGLRVLGSARHARAPMGSGSRHLRRLLDTLAEVTPGRPDPDEVTPGSFGASAGTVVMMLSPMLSDQVVTATLTLAARGLDVVVIDTLPSDHGEEGAHPGTEGAVVSLAWRMRRLERDWMLARLSRAGIPVVVWRGPGTLDEVLRRLSRRAAMPRMVRG